MPKPGLTQSLHKQPKNTTQPSKAKSGQTLLSTVSSDLSTITISMARV